MGVYTITIKDVADEILGRKWGFLTIAPDDTRTVQQFNQDYLETLVQNDFNKQTSDEAVQTAQQAAAKDQTSILVNQIVPQEKTT